MYTLAWGLTHRQLQQDSWSRMDRSLWEGYAHTFFPGGLSLYAVVAGDAAFSGCWRNHLLVARMSGKLSLKTLPRIGCEKKKKKTGWIKKKNKQAMAVKRSTFLSGIPDRGNIAAPAEVADVNQDFFQRKHSCLDVWFNKKKKKKKTDSYLFLLCFASSASNMLWLKKKKKNQKGRALYKNKYLYLQSYKKYGVRQALG